MGIPVCDFLRGLLFFWGIQLHHLTPTSILHISIFVHLCEAFLGIYPHFDLFKSLFFLNPYPNFSNVATVGGANLELRFEMAGRYIPYTPRHQIGDWSAEWFYIDNHAPSLPDRVPGPPKHCHEWFHHGYIQVQEEELLHRIVVLKNNRVTGAMVAFSWIYPSPGGSAAMLGSSILA